ncbi:hypothetical protein IWZ00DRAFT_547573 [Phyllosticta capitalensis]
MDPPPRHSHALVFPIVQLFRRASSLAEAALCSSKPEDLEMAFTADARSGFLWLNASSPTRRPACVVTTTLSTEPHLRMTFTALKLAANKPSSCTSNDDLPSFSFFADALRTALETDPFWAPFHGTSSSVEASAEKLTSHIHALVSQCAESTLKTARTFPLRTPASPLLQRHGSPDCGKLPAVKPSRLARRQQRLRMEEQAILQKLVVQCWGKAALTGAIPGGRDRAYVRAERASRESAQASESDLDKRRRSLTCPQ